MFSILLDPKLLPAEVKHFFRIQTSYMFTLLHAAASNLTLSNEDDLANALRLYAGAVKLFAELSVGFAITVQCECTPCPSQVIDPSAGNGSKASQWCKAGGGLLQNSRAWTWITRRLIHKLFHFPALMRTPSGNPRVWQPWESTKRQMVKRRWHFLHRSVQINYTPSTDFARLPHLEACFLSCCCLPADFN